MGARGLDRRLDANMLAPLAMIRLVLDGMVERAVRPHRQHHLGHGQDPVAVMGLSTGARAGLTSVAKGAVAATWPGQRDHQQPAARAHRHRPPAPDGRAAARSCGGISVEEAYDEMARTIAAGRLGRPEELGDACAFLCSAQAGFISGQNLQLDGGSYAGLV